MGARDQIVDLGEARSQEDGGTGLSLAIVSDPIPAGRAASPGPRP